MGSNPMVDLEVELLRLQSLTIFELRNDWRKSHRMSPPMRLSRDLLIRGVAYRLQQKPSGGLSKAVLRRIARLGDGTVDRADENPPAQIVLKPGTRLVREWNGVTHTVLVHDNGFEWRDERFTSLSKIASTITGTRWSGPRFFGLRRQPDTASKKGM